MPGPRLQPRVVGAKPIVTPSDGAGALGDIAQVASVALQGYGLFQQKEALDREEALKQQEQLKAQADNQALAKYQSKLGDLVIATAQDKMKPGEARIKQEQLTQEFLAANPHLRKELNVVRGTFSASKTFDVFEEKAEGAEDARVARQQKLEDMIMEERFSLGMIGPEWDKSYTLFKLRQGEKAMVQSRLDLLEATRKTETEVADIEFGKYFGMEALDNATTWVASAMQIKGDPTLLEQTEDKIMADFIHDSIGRN